MSDALTVMVFPRLPAPSHLFFQVIIKLSVRSAPASRTAAVSVVLPAPFLNTMPLSDKIETGIGLVFRDHLLDPADQALVDLGLQLFEIVKRCLIPVPDP